MTSIQSIGNNNNVAKLSELKFSTIPSFRASSTKTADVDSFVSQREKAQKDAKKQQLFSNAVLGIIAIASLASLGVLAHQQGWLKRFKLSFLDLSNKKSLDEIVKTKTMQDKTQQIVNRIENYEEIINKGGEPGTAFLMYGPPGTGKNTYAYAIAKRFKNSKFITIDIDKLNSAFHGESQKNVLGTIEATIKYARKHPDEKIFVFIDEIDSVMMVDESLNAKLSNDILNAFKKGFNELTGEKNIIVMGATNLEVNVEKGLAEGGKKLDKAMLDRFAETLHMDLPDKAGILEGIELFYNNPALTMIDDALKDIKDSRWDKIADFLSKHEHATSFRKLTKIFGTAAEKSPKGKNVTFKDIIEAIKTQKDKLNATDAEIEDFIQSLGT